MSAAGCQAARTAKLQAFRSDVRDTCASKRHFFARAKKAQKITEYRDTAPLNLGNFPAYEVFFGADLTVDREAMFAS